MSENNDETHLRKLFPTIAVPYAIPHVTSPRKVMISMRRCLIGGWLDEHVPEKDDGPAIHNLSQIVPKKCEHLNPRFERLATNSIVSASGKK